MILSQLFNLTHLAVSVLNNMTLSWLLHLTQIPFIWFFLFLTTWFHCKYLKYFIWYKQHVFLYLQLLVLSVPAYRSNSVHLYATIIPVQSTINTAPTYQSLPLFTTLTSTTLQLPTLVLHTHCQAMVIVLIICLVVVLKALIVDHSISFVTNISIILWTIPLS